MKIEPLKPPTQPVLYTEDDLHIRQFTDAARAGCRARAPPRGLDVSGGSTAQPDTRA